MFAYMNRGAIRSLGRLGVEFELLAGKDFHLPMPGDPGRYDLDYGAVCIPKDRHNMDAFTTENPERPFTRLIAGLDVPLYWLDGTRSRCRRKERWRRRVPCAAVTLRASPARQLVEAAPRQPPAAQGRGDFQ
jgi:hypothetical protein